MTNEVKIIGKRMLAAVDKIKSEPGILEYLIKKEFGYPTPDRLIAAGLARAEDSDHGRKLYAIKISDRPIPAPNSQYRILTPNIEKDALVLIRNNKLAAQCPECKMTAGNACMSLKTGRPVNFPHHQRIDASLYLLSTLIGLNDQD